MPGFNLKLLICLLRNIYIHNWSFNPASKILPCFLTQHMLCLLLLKPTTRVLQFNVDSEWKIKKISWFSEFVPQIRWEEATVKNILHFCVLKMVSQKFELGPYVSYINTLLTTKAISFLRRLSLFKNWYIHSNRQSVTN